MKRILKILGAGTAMAVGSMAFALASPAAPTSCTFTKGTTSCISHPPIQLLSSTDPYYSAGNGYIVSNNYTVSNATPTTDSRCPAYTETVYNIVLTGTVTFAVPTATTTHHGAPNATAPQTRTTTYANQTVSHYIECIGVSSDATQYTALLDS